MRVYENQEHEERMHRLDEMAEAALELYGLGGAQIVMLGEPGGVVFRVEVPADGPVAYHPYLGKVAGKRFLLRVQSASTSSAASMYTELVCLAALIRDTEMDLPEPVPACDGSLVAELSGEGMGEPQLCALFRWTGDQHSADATPGWPELASAIEEIYGQDEVLVPVPSGSALN